LIELPKLLWIFIYFCAEFGASRVNLGLIGVAPAKSAVGDQDINFKELTKLAEDIRVPSLEGSKSRSFSEIFINMGNKNHKQAEEIFKQSGADKYLETISRYK
jgi:hypothetical protein